MNFPLSYTLTGNSPQQAASGQATGRLEEESFSILPKFSEPLYFSLRDITEISEGDYKIHISLTSDEKLTLSELGYKHEDFLRILWGMRNEMIIKDMLMNESIKKSGIEADFSLSDGLKNLTGQGELLLYESAFVLIPQKGDILRIPYCNLTQISEEDFSLTLNTETDKRITLSKMGKYFDPFARALSEAINALSLKVQSTIKELVPEADPLTVRKVSRFMKEGKAARRSDIESVCPQLWKEMEKRIKTLETGKEYEFLSSLAQKNKVCIGLKRGLMGDLTGEYIWFLLPIYSLNASQPGNIVAMESVTSDENETTSNATYFFRLVDRKDYPDFDSLDRLHSITDEFITRINRCMLAINFRREPIYLPDERLREPRYKRYRAAVSLIPELRELRKLFVGRVIHRNIKQWKSDVKDLLRFNVTSSLNSEKWQKEKTNSENTEQVFTKDEEPIKKGGD